MTPPAPTLHTFDPLLAGTVALKVDPVSTGSTQIAWYAAPATGGPYTQMATTNIHTGFDGLTLIIDSPDARYWVTKVTDSSGTSSYSNEAQATVSTGPPPMTAQQALTVAIGQPINVGYQVAWSPSPATVKTVQADGSLA